MGEEEKDREGARDRPKELVCVLKYLHVPCSVHRGSALVGVSLI